jgi:hypothetical protein
LIEEVLHADAIRIPAASGVSVAATGKVDLAAHVNHQVEIKGHMGKGSAESASGDSARRTRDGDLQVWD